MRFKGTRHDLKELDTILRAPPFNDRFYLTIQLLIVPFPDPGAPGDRQR